MNRLPSLDGMRACAVTLVFLAHAGLQSLVPGGLGVTLFFVISGYLITGLLRSEHWHQHRLQLKAFYWRRAARLMPALVAVIIATGLLAAVGKVEGRFTSAGLVAALFYFGNYHLILHDFNGMPAGLGVLWSLAVEEHFYLLFPLWCAWVLPGHERRSATLQHSLRRLSGQQCSLAHRLADPAVATLLLLCLAVLGWRCWLQLHGANPLWLAMATDTRADAILAGCVLALVWHPELDRPRHHDAAREGTVAAACVALLVGTLLWRDEGFRHTWRYTVQAFALLPLVHLAVHRANWTLFRWLEARPLVYVGNRSYGIYLVHHVVLLGLAREWPAAERWQVGITGAIVTLLAADLLYRFVEQPVIAWHRHRSKRQSSDVGRPSAAMTDALPVPDAASIGESVSVCIATFRRPEKLAQLLDDLAKQRRLPEEVVVVDNDPAESARAVVEARQGAGTPYDLVYALQSKQNISLTRNRTVELARGTWLAFVDDDERAPPEWLDGLLRCARRHGANGVLGPVLPRLPADAPGWVRRGRFHDWARMPTGKLIPANRLRFGNVLLQRTCLRHLQGPFDPALGLTGGEDGDLLNRLRLEGARLVWCDEASVEEPVDASRLRFRWLWLRALRGGQDYSRHFLHGRYGPAGTRRRAAFFLRALLQMLLALALAVVTCGAGLHFGAHWLFRAAANLGKLSLLVGLHYREYAGARA